MVKDDEMMVSGVKFDIAVFIDRFNKGVQETIRSVESMIAAVNRADREVALDMIAEGRWENEGGSVVST